MNSIHRTLFIASAAGALLFALASPVLAQVDPPATIVWTGANNNSWDVAGNWNPARVPNASDHVEIATGTNVLLNVAANIASLRLGQSSGSSTQTLVMNGQTLILATNSIVNAKGVISFGSGAIGGAGLLSVQGVVDWSGGAMGASISVQASGTLNLIGSAGRSLFSGDNNNPTTLTNLGLVRWSSDSQPLTVGNGTRIVNRGTWRLERDGTPFSYYTGAQSTFLNQGTFIKASGTNNAEMDGTVTFTNQATIVAQSSPIRFSGTASFESGSQFNGPFPIRLEGTMFFDRPVLNTLVELAAGTLNGDVTFTGTTSVLNWSGGQITRSLTIPPNGTLNLIGSAGRSLFSGDNSAPTTLTNLGLVRWSSNSQPLTVGYGTRIVNSGTWRLEQDGAPFNFYTGAQPTFLNQGTFIKASGTNNAEIDGTVTFTNQATIVAESSPIRFSGMASFESSSQINGPFPIRLEGTMFFDRPVLNTLVELAAGSLNGDVTFTGTTSVLNWSGGQITRSLTIPPNGTLNLIGNAGRNLFSGDNNNPTTLTNLGLVRWSTSKPLTVGYGTRIVNSGTWRLEADGSPFGYYTGSPSTFLNRGVLSKGETTGTAAIDAVIFQNEGTLAISLGRLQLSAAATLAAASVVNVSIGGTNALTEHGQLEFAGSGTVRGNIAVTLTGGFVPAVSNRFLLVQATPLAGSFASQNLSSLPAGLLWTFDQAASSLSLVVESTTNQPACVVSPSGLALWLPAEDSPINRAGSNYAVLNNGATYGFGRVGRAFMLDGVNDYVSVADSPSLRGTNLTVEGWFKFFSLGVPRILVSKTLGSSYLNSHTLWIQDGNLYFALSDASSYGLISTPLNPTINTWYHLAVTFDDQANVMRLFINGVLAASQTENRSIAYDDHPVTLGVEYENESLSSFAHGLFDEVAIYNRALSTNEIASVYAAGASGKCTNGLPAPPACLVPSSGLVGWWPGDGYTNNLVAGGDAATLLNGATTAPGLVNDGFSLDGGDDLISIGDLPALQNATELTLMAWVSKPYGAVNLGAIIGKWDTGPNPAANSFLLFNGEDA